MKKFLLHAVLFSALLFLSMLFVFLIANGKTDPYYLRFTTSRQSSLIIGTSRAAQGLQPSVFDQIIYNNQARHFYNYAFSLIDSPFGPAYLQSIQKKLDPDTRDGIFLIAVDPWSISATTADPNNEKHFIENKTFIGKTKFVNLNPNLPYLISSFNEPYFNIIRKWKGSPIHYLHKDGWLELNIPNDSMAFAKGTAAKLAFYRNNYLPVYKFSALRLQYLAKIINLFKKHGKIYLVRLPVQESMFALENELMPAFDDTIKQLAAKENIQFLNFRELKNEYQYVDGNHLYKTSGKKVSAIIAGWIAAAQESRP